MVRQSQQNLDALTPEEVQATAQPVKRGAQGLNLELFTFFSSAVERLQDFREEQFMTQEEIEQARAEDKELNAMLQFKSEPDEKYLQTRDKEMKAADLAELNVLFPGMTPEQIRDEYIAAFGEEVKAQQIEATVQFRTPELRKWTVRRKFNNRSHLRNFINYIENKKGYKFDEVWEHGAPPEVDPSDVIKSQRPALDMMDQEIPSKVGSTVQVARLMNSWADSPALEDGNILQRFFENVYQEVGFYLRAKDARTGGITWYTEDITETKQKLAVIFPALESEAMSSVGIALLALSSSGNSPIQNMLTLAAILKNTPVDQQRKGNFSRNWGPDKMSFVDKKGKSLVSGRIVKEGKTFYMVQPVDPLGRDVKDPIKIKKNQMKAGYPKPTGYTNRGKTVAAQLDKLQAVFDRFKTPEAAVEFLTSDQPIELLREFNKSVPDVNGKVNKKPAPGRRKGAYIFGEKIGSFFLNMEGLGESLTADLWFNRTWNRYMGTMINTVKGVDQVVETPRSESERALMTTAVTEAATELGLTTAELQAALWYFEQELWRRMGQNSRSENYAMAIDNVASRMDLNDDTRARLEEAGVNLDKAEERRETAVARADAKSDAKYITRVREGEQVKSQALESEWISENNPKLMAAGILIHGTSAEFESFSPSMSFAQAGVYGKGVYMTHVMQKAMSYGKRAIFVDGEGVRLANLQSTEVATNVMNEVLRGPAAVAAGRAPLSQLTEVSRYNLFNLLYQDALTRSGIPLEQVIGIGELRPRNSQSRFYDPVELTEAIYAELYNVAKDLNTPLSKKMVGSGLNGVRAALTNPNFSNFFRDVMRRYNNRLSERGVERRLFENDEFKSAELQDLIEGVYTRVVMDAGYHGVYVSPMSDNGGSVYEMDDSRHTEAGISGGLVQEAIIFNVSAVNENIVKFEDVEPLINSRIAAGKTRVKTTVS